MAIDIEKLAQMGSMAATGGYAQAALGGLQAVYGLTQLPKAKAEFERAKAAAPSLDTPAQFYENYKNAYDSTMARMQNDAIQANLATSVQALQGAGGRALVGGLNQATAQAQASQNQMLAQERQMRMAAGQQLAAAQERSIGRKEARSQQEIAYANQGYQAALGNIGSGLASAGEGLMYGLSSAQGGKSKTTTPETTTAVQDGLIKQSAIKGTEALQKDLEMNDFKLNEIQSQEEAEVAEDFVGNLANLEDARLQAEASSKKAGVLPRLNTRFQAGKAIRQTTLGDIGGVPRASLPSKPIDALSAPSFNPAQALQPVDMTKPPATLNSFPNPQGSPIPVEYRNKQAMKQLNALSKVYNQFYPAANTLFEQGGMMTNGAFNHNTNPIDLVQNGQKVGEATGGEYILNPNQAKAIGKQSSYARKLFKKFEKNAKKKK
jgi:hypothetical protein